MLSSVIYPILVIGLIVLVIVLLIFLIKYRGEHNEIEHKRQEIQNQQEEINIAQQNIQQERQNIHKTIESAVQKATAVEHQQLVQTRSYLDNLLLEAQQEEEERKETGKRRRVSKKMKEYIYNRDDFRCQICSISKSYFDNIHPLLGDYLLLEIDHIDSVANGGTGKDEDNLQVLCWRCNRKKGKNRTNDDVESMIDYGLKMIDPLAYDEWKYSRPQITSSPPEIVNAEQLDYSRPILPKSEAELLQVDTKPQFVNQRVPEQYRGPSKSLIGNATDTVIKTNKLCSTCKVGYLNITEKNFNVVRYECSNCKKKYKKDVESKNTRSSKIK